MIHPSFIVIDGKRYRWRDIQQLRREQLAAARSKRYISDQSLRKSGPLPSHLLRGCCLLRINQAILHVR
jgi:hypothetical protein